MRALITGGAGFIGLHLAKLLLKENYKVDLLDNFSIGILDSELNQILQNSNIKLIEADLIDNDSFKKVNNNYDFIFHFAAILGVENVINMPYEVLDKNVRLTFNAINIAKNQKSLKCFIFSSTSEIYAGTLENNLLTIPTEEKSLIVLPSLEKPRTSYMLSKAYGEALCTQSNIPFLIIRPNNIYGPRMGMAHVIPQLLKKAFTQDDDGYLEVYSLRHTRTFCYVDDAVIGTVSAMESEKAAGQIYHIGNEEEINMELLTKYIGKILKYSGDYENAITFPGSVARRCPNIKKAELDLNYLPKFKWRDAVGLTTEWYKEFFKSGKTPSTGGFEPPESFLVVKD